MMASLTPTRKTVLAGFFLFVCGLLVNSAVAWFQTAPGYMDADYYYAGGLQIASGRGFYEPYLWHYLDDPTRLPHPSHTYWMPLASLLAAAGLLVAPTPGFSAAQVGFILVAACVPPMTAALALSLTPKKTLAFAAGMLAVFSGFYAPFLPTTDTFGLYMLGGAGFLLLARRLAGHKSARLALPMGLIAGLMHLSRADGLLWLGLLVLVVAWVFRTQPRRLFIALAFGILAYLAVMSPWYIRNLTHFGTLMSPGSNRALWLTEYDRLFAYPASQINFENWRAAGLQSALNARLWSAGINLQNTLAVQGGIFLVPFILVGLWKMRRSLPVSLGVAAWALTFIAMTLPFPFAGARGGFFHSGAAVQPLWWALAPIGLDAVAAWAAARIPTWSVERAQPGFRTLMLGLAAFLTLTLILTRLLGPTWNAYAGDYAAIEARLIALGVPKTEPVIVSNPPGYYIHSGRPAIALPDGSLPTLQALRDQFGARFVIMDEISTPAGLAPLYHAGPSVQGLRYIGEVNGARIFEIP